MAFTTRRGRPPKAAAGRTDPGTPELRFKQAHGLTAEPIDRCLDRQLITPQQHWCGLHLRWLHTLRYGAPSLTLRYHAPGESAPRADDTDAWRRLREAEYREAAALLRAARYDEPVMRLCVHNEPPAFLSARLLARAWDDPALAARLERARQQLHGGLELLVQHWRARR